MYKEVHPYYVDYGEQYKASRTGEKRPLSDFYKEGDKVTQRLDTIKRVCTEKVPDDSIKLMRLCIGEDHSEDLVVTPEEGEEINNLLLKMNGSPLAKEIPMLTKAIRDLWELLRARLH